MKPARNSPPGIPQIVVVKISPNIMLDCRRVVDSLGRERTEEEWLAGQPTRVVLADGETDQLRLKPVQGHFWHHVRGQRLAR